MLASSCLVVPVCEPVYLAARRPARQTSYLPINL